MSLLIDTADAVVAEINAATTLTKPIQAARTYDPEWELKETLRLVGHVVLVARDDEFQTREESETEVELDLVVRKRFDLASQHGQTGKLMMRDVDEYVGFFEELVEYLRERDHRQLSAYTDAHLIKSKIRMPYVPEHLRKWNQFTGLARLTYYIT